MLVFDFTDNDYIKDFLMKKLLKIFTVSIFLPIFFLGCSDKKVDSECDPTKFDCTPKPSVPVSSVDDTAAKVTSDSIIEDGDVIQTATAAAEHVKLDGIRLSNCGGNDYCTDTSMLVNFAYSMNPNNTDHIESLEFYLPTDIQPFHIDAIKINTKKKGACEVDGFNSGGYQLTENGLSISVKNCQFDQVKDVIIVINGENYII